MKKWGLLLILLLSLLPRTAFAAETADAICIEGEMEGLDMEAVDAAAEEMDAAVSFSDLLAEILSGEFDFTFANIKPTRPMAMILPISIRPPPQS